MRRREIITILGGGAIAWPRRALAQPSRTRRIGVLMGGPNEGVGEMHAAALMQWLGALKWHDGGNLRIDWRWAAGNPALDEQYAIELIAL